MGRGMITVKCGIFKGCDMHTTREGWYDVIWEYPAGMDEGSVEPDVVYCVVYEYDQWDTGGLAGDSCGCKHTVVKAEPVPAEILSLMEEEKEIRRKINEYKEKIRKG